MLNKSIFIAFVILTTMAEKCPNDKMCLNCDGTTCTVCYNSYLDSGHCEEPEKKVDNCVSYLNKDTCGGCDDGYFLASGKCEKLTVENCLNGSALDKCAVCDGGKQSKIDGTCSADNCSLENCESCLLDICFICKSGYSLKVDGTKLSCIKEPSKGCWTVEPTDDMKCDSCKPGYYYSGEGKCSKGSKIMMVAAVAFIVALFQL